MYDSYSHSTRVQKPSEAKDAIDAADTLGLELQNVQVRGWWKCEDDAAINEHAKCQIEKIGRKWFYLDVDGTVLKCRPRKASDQYGGEDGELLLNFN